MTYRDFKNVGSCDHCGYEDSFIVGQDSDGNYCDKCEQAEGFAAIYEEQAQRLAAKQFAMNVVMLTAGVLIGSVVTLYAEAIR